MTFGSERRAVQNPFIRYAQEVGWTYLPREEASRLRGGEDSPFLRSVLIEQLQRLNPRVVVEKTKETVKRLEGVRPGIEGNLEVWEYLKSGKTVFVEIERRERNLHLLDLENPKANTFHITDEFSFRSGRNTIRADIVLFVNGIPVIIVETKSATNHESISEALDQIRRYHNEAPELMAQAQLFVLTDLVRFLYGPTWNISRKALFDWRAEQAGDFESLVKTFVAPSRVLQVLTDYILFIRKDGELTKAVLSSHQMRAVEKVLDRAKDPEKHRGLIWHTQGSGKTYTMITVARCLLKDPRFQNPTVLMIVDRNELQQQLFQNLEAVGFERVYVAESKRHLRELLKNDTRGLIVSMIHKFDDADTNLNTRKNIFVLVDEAHRSTGNQLGNYLMGALPKATFIGFTGTPIDKSAHGKGTFKVFGSEDPLGYLDKYSIRESIKDGTTVPLHYQMAPNDLIVDKEAMEEEFWSVVELEGIADTEELDRVLDKAVRLKNMLKNRKRVDKIAQFVADHFKKYVQPMGYKAFLVAVDREACRLYKEALDEYLPKEMTQVVISRNNNDPPELKRYYLSEQEEAEVRKSFRKPDENPQILIVTEKLLTGYDAPILYCMYLDKPMRDHVLLQAIARVNRPYEDKVGRRKTNGLIVDFVGIFDKLERALAFDYQDVEGVVESLDVLKERFKDLMEHGKRYYLSLIAGKDEDKAAEAVLEHFRDEKIRKDFYTYFRELEELYEILSPDPFLRPYMDDYNILVDMYRLLHSAYEPHTPVDKSLLRKTTQIVKRHTKTRFVLEPQATYEIGVEVLIRILHEEKPEMVKVFNLLNEIYRIVEVKGKEQPYLISIGERAEAIKRAFEERQKSSQQALQELGELVKHIQEAEAEHQKSNLSPEAFAVKWWLRVHKGMEPELADRLASQMGSAFSEFPHWAVSKTQESELRKRLYKILINNGVKEKEVVIWVEDLLTLLRRGFQ